MSIKIRFLKNQNSKTISKLDTILYCDVENSYLNINNENIFSWEKNKIIGTFKIKEYKESKEFFYEHYEIQFFDDNSYNYNFNINAREYCIIYIDDIEIAKGLCKLKSITELNNIVYFEIEVVEEIEDLFEKSKHIKINEIDSFNIIWNEDNIKQMLSDEINGFSLVPLNDGESVRQNNINNSIKTIFDTNTIPVAVNLDKILSSGLNLLGLSIDENSFLNSDYINNLWIFDNKSEMIDLYDTTIQSLINFSYENLSYNSNEKYTIISIESDSLTGISFTGNNYSIYSKKYNSNISPYNIEKKEKDKYNFSFKTVSEQYDEEFYKYANSNNKTITLVCNTNYNIKINITNCNLNSNDNINIYRLHAILKFKNAKTNEEEFYDFYSDFSEIGYPLNLSIDFNKFVNDNTILSIYLQEEIGIGYSLNNKKECIFNISKTIETYSLEIKKIKNDKIRSNGKEIDLFTQLPQITFYDILIGLQQMFNLVYKIHDNILSAIPLNDFYDKHNYCNIDKLVNYDKEIIIKPAIDDFKYKNISLKYDINKADYYNFYSYLYNNKEYGEYNEIIDCYNNDTINIKNIFSLCKIGTYKYNNLLEFTSSFNITNENLLKVTPTNCFIGYKETKTFNIPLNTIYLYQNEYNYNSYNLNVYNVFHHLNPELDYCYDTPKFIFFNSNEYQFKNLFSEFFYKSIQENISDQSKIIYLYANINIEILKQLYTTNVIYFKNTYWKLLEIKNWQCINTNAILKLLKIIDIEKLNLKNKHVTQIDINQNYLKPILIDENFLSEPFLSELSNNSAIISTSIELFNLHDIIENIANLQESIISLTAGTGIYIDSENKINVNIDNDTIKINEENKLYANVSGGSEYTAGNALSLTNNEFNVLIDNDTIKINEENKLYAIIPEYTAGDALSLTENNFDVLVDNGTIKINEENKLYANLVDYFTINTYFKQSFITYLENFNYYINLQYNVTYNLLTSLTKRLESRFMRYIDNKIIIDIHELTNYEVLKSYIENNLILDIEHKDSIFITYQDKIYIFNYTDSTFTLIYTQPDGYTISDIYYCKESTYYNALPTLYFIANGTLWNLEKGNTAINCTKFIIYNHEVFVFYNGTITRYDISGQGTEEATDVNVDGFFIGRGDILYWDTNLSRTYIRQSGDWNLYVDDYAYKKLVYYGVREIPIILNYIDCFLHNNKLFIFKGDGIYRYAWYELYLSNYTISGNIIKASCTEDYAYIYTDANKLYKFDGDILIEIGTYNISGILAISTKDTKFQISQDTANNNIQFGNNAQSIILEKAHYSNYELNLYQLDNFYTTFLIKKIAVKTEIKTVKESWDLLVLDGLTLWLKADEGVTCDSNYKVSEWNDASGNGYVFSQSNSDKQPLFDPNGLNNLPVLSFDGNDYLRVDFPSPYTQPCTIFTIWKTNASNGQTLIDNLASPNHFLDNLRGTGVRLYAGSEITYLKSNPFDFILTTGIYNFANSKLYENDILKGTGNVGTESVYGFCIGYRSAFNDRYFNGSVAEIIFYNRELSYNEIVLVWAYLNNKYNLW